MSKTAIIYWSGTGNTEEMAMAIAKGAKEGAGTEVSVFTVDQINANEAAKYDNLILGCPSMGAEVLEESEFEPFYADLEKQINGKNVGLFGSYGWGDGEWMRNWEDSVKQAGANLVDGEGVIINETPDSEGLERCRAFGMVISKL